MSKSAKSLLSQLSNGQAEYHFGVNTLREDYSATIEITDPNGVYFLELLQDLGFETIREKGDVYTVKFEL